MNHSFPHISILIIALLALLAPHTLKAQDDSIGLYCPMDFNATFTSPRLSSQLRTAIADGTLLNAIDMT